MNKLVKRKRHYNKIVDIFFSTFCIITINKDVEYDNKYLSFLLRSLKYNDKNV